MSIITVHYTDQDNSHSSVVRIITKAEKRFYVDAGQTRNAKATLANLTLAGCGKRNVRITGSSVRL